jgi:hypothetical protein
VGIRTRGASKIVLILAAWLAAAAFTLPCIAHAFGLKTHLWIGQRLLSEIYSSCRVDVDGAPIEIDPQVCHSLRSHPDSFLSGVLGPDAYPDVITGQVTTHPGVKGDWQTNDWLLHMYSQAPPGPHLAFAAGYLVHAAADMFAHTYVNSYAGDIFLLEGERRVELRHFLLEKYIDSKLPNYTYSPSMLRPPAEYLRDRLIHNADASRVAKASNIALHITAMHDVHRTVTDLARELDRIENDAARLLSGLIVAIGEYNLKLATGEVQLKTAREILSGNEQRLKAQQALFDAANQAFQDAASALQKNMDLINTVGQQAKAARAAAEQAQRIGREAIDRATALQEEILDFESRLANIPPYLPKEVCKDEVVDTICGVFCPICRRVCKDSVKRVCRIFHEVNSRWTQLNNQLTNARRELARAQGRAAQAALDVSTNLAIEAAKLQEKASTEALTAGLEAIKTAAQAMYEIEKARLDVELRATREARNTVDRIAAEVEELRKRIIDSESIKQALQDLIARSDILSGLAKTWVRGMDVGGKDFILASDRVSKGMLEGTSNFVSTYLDWWKCTGQAYVAVPVQFGQAVCAVEDFMNKLDEEVSKIIVRVLPPPFDRVYEDYLNIRAMIKEELKSKVNDAGIYLTKFVSPDATTGEFIELLARPVNASQAMMNDAFATAADSGKPLLVFDRVSDLIDADIGLRSDKLDPDTFAALKNALVLARLSLMDMRGIMALAWVLGANSDAIETPAAPGRTSLLFDTVRSIDGNHQWQPFGLPYPSAAGAEPRPMNPLERAYGYGPTQRRPGLQLFIEDEFRRSMFLRIFQGPISASLTKHLNLAGYPFPECTRHPFAVGFKPDGTGADRDDGCNTNTEGPPNRSSGEWWRRLLNWLRLNPQQ